MNQEFSLWSFWAGVALIAQLQFWAPIPADDNGKRLFLAVVLTGIAVAVWAIRKEP